MELAQCSGTAEFHKKILNVFGPFHNSNLGLSLTLIGMRKDTFIPLYFLDWILLAEFLSKLS